MLTGRKSGSISRIRPARPRAGDQVHHSSLGVGDMVQHGAGRHQIKVSRLDRPREDVGLAKLEPGYVRVGQGQVEVHRDRPPAGRDPPGQPGRHGAVTAANFERPRPRPGTQPLKVAAVHRIEQPRHQRQPLALAFLVMIKDVLWHAAPGRLRPNDSRSADPKAARLNSLGAHRQRVESRLNRPTAALTWHREAAGRAETYRAV